LFPADRPVDDAVIGIHLFFYCDFDSGMKIDSTSSFISNSISALERLFCSEVVEMFMSAADHDWNDYWYTLGSANLWIQFDFKTRRVSFTHYTLKSDGSGCSHPLEWTIAGSCDGTSWDSIDCRKTQDSNGNDITKTDDLSSRRLEHVSFVTFDRHK
jgi:hypothetical protein